MNDKLRGINRYYVALHVIRKNIIGIKTKFTICKTILRLGEMNEVKTWVIALRKDWKCGRIIRIVNDGDIWEPLNKCEGNGVLIEKLGFLKMRWDELNSKRKRENE